MYFGATLSKSQEKCYNPGMQTKAFERYFFFGLLVITFIFSFFILRPFWTVLVLGISFSVILYPIHQWLVDRKIPYWVSSLFTVLIFSLFLFGPILGIGALVFDQSRDVYQSVVANNNSMPILDAINDGINGLLPAGVDFDIHDKASSVVSYVSGNIATIFSTTVSAFFSLILMLLIIFYFLKDGAEWKKALVLLSPLNDTDDIKIISRLTVAIKSVILGNLLIAGIQGILLGFGLWLFGVPNAAVWGLVAAITSLIPTIGTALVSIPAIIFLLVTGSNAQALGLLIWAGLAVGMIDNFLSPFIIAGKTNVSPLLILFSVLGGVSLLGPVGILVGPLTISLLYTLILIYRNDLTKQNAQSTPL